MCTSYGDLIHVEAFAHELLLGWTTTRWSRWSHTGRHAPHAFGLDGSAEQLTNGDDVAVIAVAAAGDPPSPAVASLVVPPMSPRWRTARSAR